jgi:monovalent cation:H+ antiporter, CPA1 family
MRLFDIIAILIVLSATFGFINFRFLKLPETIGSMALALVFSLVVLAIGAVFPAIQHRGRDLVEMLDLNEALLQGMLGFLLFAGALHIDLGDLNQYKWPIAVMATLGVLMSTAIVGGMIWCLLSLLGVTARPVDCFLFGALISPTDPIAVLSLLKKMRAPKRLEIQIAGESLFNDGVGVVVFTALLGIASGNQEFDLGHLGVLFAREVLGGALFGLTIGYVVYRLLKSVDDYQVEIAVSLALVAGGYALAHALHVSGPLAMVFAGLLIGNHGRTFAMSPTTVEHLDLFWELVDQILNATLFVLIGLEILVLTFTSRYLLAGFVAFPIVLIARAISVGLPLWILRRRHDFEPSLVPVLTWGGLRGGISVALALSVPIAGPGNWAKAREGIIAMTYVVVVLSILVQGLSVSRFARRWLPHEPPTQS